jgi:hypothetical protein
MVQPIVLAFMARIQQIVPATPIAKRQEMKTIGGKAEIS